MTEFNGETIRDQLQRAEDEAEMSIDQNARIKNNTVQYIAPILREIGEDSIQQDVQFGAQSHDIVYPLRNTDNVHQIYRRQAKQLKVMNNQRVKDDTVCWDGILLEEVYSALSESDLALMREKLIKVASETIAIIKDIDRREK